MDAFFAAVSVRDRPELAGRPVIVGGGPTQGGGMRGVVLSATYPARRAGVRSGMPAARARRLCPEAVFLRCDHESIEQVSRSVMALFREITPTVEAISVDEAFLDVSGSLRRLGSPLQVAEHIRARVADEQRITCSVGVATSASVAKLASRRAKPDGVVVVPRDRMTSFLHPLAVEELWGVGEKTRERLNAVGLVTVGDVAHAPMATLRRALGPHAGAHVRALAWGADGRRVRERRGIDVPDRSIGAEETFGHDTGDPATVQRELLRLSAKVAARTRANGLAGRTVSLKVRWSDFTTLTRSHTLVDPTDVTEEIYSVVGTLYDAVNPARRTVRLVGVRVEGLVPCEGVQRQLVLGARERGWREADQAVDRATSRFGRSAVRPASLLAGGRP
ncbi:DNA polymerase IV [Nocardioides mangrovicus]|uniref:DNA polymerase IV n=2 Tax=Nocardioides mangrovicus TaxID=2478913 RepID=A0A3L8P3P9_9ACTN|nr:DNA polymerase IV [Nocardioides mangrovicus]